MKKYILLSALKKLVEADFKSVKTKFLKQDIKETEVKKYLDLFKADEKNIDFWGKKPFNEFKQDDSPIFKFLSSEVYKASIKITDVSSGVEDTDYSYYHVSNHISTPSIHKDSPRIYTDPEGIYLFIKGMHVEIDEWERKKYRWDAKLKDESKYLNVEHFGHDFDKVLKKLNIKDIDELYAIVESKKNDDSDGYMEEVYDDLYDMKTYDPWNHEAVKEFFKSNYWRMYEFVRGYLNNRTKFKNLLVSLGYKGIIDHEGVCLYSGEPQIVVFDPTNIEWGPREENTELY